MPFGTQFFFLGFADYLLVLCRASRYPSQVLAAKESKKIISWPAYDRAVFDRKLERPADVEITVRTVE